MFFILPILIYCIFIPSIANQMQHYFDGTYSIDSIDCPNNKKCIFVEHCPVVSNLMNQNLLPIHRFRQAVCGYESTRLKVCCNPVNPFFMQEDSGYYSRLNSILECGKSFVPGDVLNSIGMYPFIARIGFKSSTGGTKYPCSGTILNKWTILTTANCALAKSIDYRLDSVLVGEFNAETDSDCNIQRLNISHVIKHPNYQAETFANNIAMLRLKEPLQYTVTAQPVCLLPRDKYINVGVTSVLVGWGQLRNQKAQPCRQQFVIMTILSNKQCTSYYNQGLSVELCAIGREMPCSGYSGSPLLFKYGDMPYSLLGILSYGSNCSTITNFPTVFVNIQGHIRWILENC
ncbi:chymotrypsinogen B [Xylocopa sonorina]|uniref:chymotrypsinogen B n=1 Tax=Xylocopa sonorina TaxID=1818115 RepID=UPI00403A81C5